jgi:two-component system KDP operon response regulator KdpE
LEAGADDYITKPFSMGELIARLRVALRHAALIRESAGAAARNPGHPSVPSVFRYRDLTIDVQRRRVTVGDVAVHLTPTEYELLRYLAQHAGKVVTHRVLLHAIWGPEAEMKPQYLRVFINQLRRKLEPDPSHPRFLLTETHIGYQMPSQEA